MPYIVINGEVHDGSKVYGVGSFLPGAKGSLADMEEVGAVAWKEAPAPPAKTKESGKKVKT